MSIESLRLISQGNNLFFYNKSYKNNTSNKSSLFLIKKKAILLKRTIKYLIECKVKPIYDVALVSDNYPF